MTKECDSPKEPPRVIALRRNLEKLKLELHSINQGVQSYILRQRINGTWGAARYGIGEEDDTDTESDGVFNYTDEDDDDRPLLRCPFCDFEIEFSSVCTHLEEGHCYDPKNMLCPVCDENLGEDAIRAALNSSAQKRTWKSDKSSISSDGDSVVLDKKLPARRSKHEAVPDSLLSSFVCNVSVPNSCGIHLGKGSSGADAPLDSGDEQDIEERRLRASFAQELVLSTLM